MIKGAKIIACWAVIAVSSGNSVAVAQAIRMELSVQSGAPVTAGHDWLKSLSKLPVGNVRISNEATLRPSTEKSASGILVRGIISRGNKLIVTGGAFSLSERTRLMQWLEDLQAGKLEEDRDYAFGLTAEELVALHEALAVPMLDSTREQKPRVIVTRISRRISLTLQTSARARGRFSDAELVHDEFADVSCGTALAAVLKPLGLVFAPHRKGGELALIIGDSRDVAEAWPIGWPPVQKPHLLAPKLSEKLTVEINEVALQTALSAIDEKIDLPILFDYDGMAGKDRIEPANIKVSYPAGRTDYRKLLRRILYQAKLKSELRVDEAEQPFLWITPIKPRSP